MIIRPLLIACVLAVLPAQAAPEVLLPFEVLEKGSFSGMQQNKPILTQLQDEASWDKFLSQHPALAPHLKEKMPNFSRKQAIAIIDSDQPNSAYRLKLNRVEQHNGELWVYVIREQPRPECLNLGKVTQPFILITLNRFEGPAKLMFNTQLHGC